MRERQMRAEAARSDLDGAAPLNETVPENMSLAPNGARAGEADSPAHARPLASPDPFRKRVELPPVRRELTTSSPLNHWGFCVVVIVAGRLDEIRAHKTEGTCLRPRDGCS